MWVIELTCFAEMSDPHPNRWAGPGDGRGATDPVVGCDAGAEGAGPDDDGADAVGEGAAEALTDGTSLGAAEPDPEL